MKPRPTFDPLNNLDQMASLISEISGETPQRAVERLEYERAHPGQNVADDFKRHGGPRYEWGEHLLSFYSATNAFIYELAVWNRNHFKRKLRRFTTRHLARQKRPLDILSVGDGLGFDCLHFAARQHRLTYFELPGLSERFARKLFEKTGRPIPVLTDPAAIPAEGYDAVTCFDVLEHVPDPPAMVRTLASYLRPGGHLYVSAPFYMILPWYPTHLRSNRRFAGNIELYRQAGLELVDGHLTWYPLVLQKQPCPSPDQPSLGAMSVRLTSLIQMLGQRLAWPFFPIHLARRICNRRFETGSGAAH
jgi:SAM-dependent methyltransferase